MEERRGGQVSVWRRELTLRWALSCFPVLCADGDLRWGGVAEASNRGPDMMRGAHFGSLRQQMIGRVWSTAVSTNLAQRRIAGVTSATEGPGGFVLVKFTSAPPPVRHPHPR